MKIDLWEISKNSLLVIYLWYNSREWQNGLELEQAKQKVEKLIDPRKISPRFDGARKLGK